MPTAGAEWIWIDSHSAPTVPTAFLAARDFRLEVETLATRVAIQADEEYQLYLDGRWLGGNRYLLGAEVDVYRLEQPLLPGRHRLVVEARSSSASGGILVVLSDGDRPLLESDRSWQTFDSAVPGLVEGWSSLDGGRPARSWGPPPLGRWGRPRLGEPVAPAGSRSQWAEAASFLAVDNGWGGSESGYLIDFGRVVSGRLEVWLDESEVTRLRSAGVSAAPARFAQAPEALGGRHADAWVIPVRGSQRWRDACPRVFRYAWIGTASPPSSARVIEVDPGDPFLAPEGELAKERKQGPFGLPAPAQRQD